MDPVASLIASLPHPSVEALTVIGDRLAADDPHRRALPALQAVARNIGDAELLRDALAVDGLHPVVRACLLHALTIRICVHHDLTTAQRLAGILDALIDEQMSVPLRLMPQRTWFHIGLACHDLRMQEQALAKAEPLIADQEGSDHWLEWRVQRLRYYLSMHDLINMDQLFAELEPYGEQLTIRVGVDVAAFHDEYICSLGDAQRAQRRLGDMTRPPPSTVNKALLQLAAGRFEDCERSLQELRGAPNQSPSLIANIINMRGDLALLRRDADGLRRAVSDMSQALADGRIDNREYVDMLALLSALAQGSVTQARFILERLCPGGAPCHAVEWARLHELEGNREQAIRHLAVALRRGGPTFLAWRLGFAWELSAQQIAQWWSQAMQATDEDAQPSPPERRKSQSRSRAMHESEAILVGNSPPMQQVRRLIDRLATRPETVLIVGETGTGKEICARMLHACSDRHEQPMVVVNCAGLPESLAESELFGHVRGAFTGAHRDRPGAFAEAATGTVFLDEIASLPLRLQGLLLRVLELGDYQAVGATNKRRFHGRVLAASHRPLADLVEEGTFRADLRYRLERMTILLPPLRDRREDLPQLAQHFIAQGGLNPPPRVSEELMAGWLRRSWSGNVRELRNEIERLLVFHDGSGILRGSTQAAEQGLSAQAAEGESGGRAAVRGRPTRRRAGKTSDDPQPRRPLRGGASALRRWQGALALLEEQGWLTRKSLAERLGCAPNSAAATLAALQEEGHIRRVMTSEHLRTSYFIASEGEGRGVD